MVLLKIFSLGKRHCKAFKKEIFFNLQDTDLSTYIYGNYQRTVLQNSIVIKKNQAYLLLNFIHIYILGIDFKCDHTINTVNGKVHIDLDPDYQVTLYILKTLLMY